MRSRSSTLPSVAAIVLATVVAVLLRVGIGSDPGGIAEKGPPTASASGRPVSPAPREANRAPGATPGAPGGERQAPPTEGATVTNRRQEALTVGTVQTPDGVPVPGAFVSMGDLDAGGATDLTGSDGRFAIDDMPSYSTLHAAALCGDTVWHGEVPADGAPFDWTITLHPPSSARDRVVLVDVVDPSGRPVPRAQATPVSGRVRIPFRAHWYEGVAVANGRFPVHAARWREGEVPVFVVRDPRDSEGRPLPLGPALVAVDPGGPATVEVRLPVGGTLEGRVQLPDGSSAGKHLVSFGCPLPEGFDTGRMDRPPPLFQWTDDSGRFAFAAGLAGRGVLDVPAKAGVHAGSGPVEAVAGGPEVVLRLRDAIDLSFLVLDGAGRPVEGGRVRTWTVGEDPGPDAAIGQGGRCEVQGLPGGAEVKVRVEAPGFVPFEGTVRADGTLQRIALEEAGVLTGRVLGPDGEQIRDLLLGVEPAGASSVWWLADGAFSIRGLPRGARVALSLLDDMREVGTVEASADGGEVVLRWPAEEDRLTLMLEDLEWGEATRVVLLEGGRAIAKGRSPWHPSARLIVLPAEGLPSRVDVQVGPTDRGRFAFLRGVPSHGFLRVALSRGVSLGGRVTVPGGGGAECVRCVATAEGGFAVKFEADRFGNFEVGGLPPGPVVLAVTGEDGPEGIATALAPAKDVHLELARR